MTAALQRLHDVAGGSATSEFRAVQLSSEGVVADVAVADPLDGPGAIVRIRQTPDAMLPGVRAFLAVEKARTLGEVAAVSPPLAVLREAEVPQSFALRLVTSATAAEIEAAIRSAGDVERVEVDTSGRTRTRTHATVETASEGAAPGPVRPATRHTSAVADLSRLDALMNLIRRSSSSRAAGCSSSPPPAPDPTMDEVMQQASRSNT